MRCRTSDMHPHAHPQRCTHLSFLKELTSKYAAKISLCIYTLIRCPHLILFCSYVGGLKISTSRPSSNVTDNIKIIPATISPIKKTEGYHD